MRKLISLSALHRSFSSPVLRSRAGQRCSQEASSYATALRAATSEDARSKGTGPAKEISSLGRSVAPRSTRPLDHPLRPTRSCIRMRSACSIRPILRGPTTSTRRPTNLTQRSWSGNAKTASPSPSTADQTLSSASGQSHPHLTRRTGAARPSRSRSTAAAV
jgi:hypothetical protein